MDNQPDTDKKLGPWQALGFIGAFLFMLLGFVWGFAAIFVSYV